MTTRASDELNKIGKAKELKIVSLRRDSTLRNLVVIWVVGDHLYVRAYKGRTGLWFRGTQERHEGHIRAGGIVKDVTFVDEAVPDINDQIDVANRTKYHWYGAQYLDPMLTAEARSATIKPVPRSTSP